MMKNRPGEKIKLASLDELLGVVNVAKIDLLLAQHYAKLDDQQISFRQKL